MSKIGRVGKLTIEDARDAVNVAVLFSPIHERGTGTAARKEGDLIGVVNLLEKYYVKARIDPRFNRKLARELDVSVCPTFAIYRADGTLVDTRAGKLEPVQMRGFLVKNRYN